MFEIDVEDHRDVRLDDLRELRNFAARVGAAFEDGRAMLAGESENRHRHADQVVEIAGRGKRRAEERASGGGGEFLGGGLADCAADCDQREGASGARAHEMAAREPSERIEGIVNLDAIEGRVTASGRDNRGSRPQRGGLREIVVTVGGSAVQRDEQGSGS